MGDEDKQRVPRSGTRTPRKRDRERTEQELLTAARELLVRDGVLAGLNLNEVATTAGVNRGQIYQYFGNRRSLLRASIRDILKSALTNVAELSSKPFLERRTGMFRWALAYPDLIRYEALLALDGDPEMDPFPQLPHALRAISRDIDQGLLDPEADGAVMHVMTAATYMGYVLFREPFAQATGTDPDELDERAIKVYRQMVAGLLTSENRCTCGHSVRRR